MIKYLVSVHTMVSQGSEMKNENWDYTFDDSNKQPFDLRLAAISKAKDLLDFYSNGMPEGYEFSSPQEVLFQKPESFSAFSISISFINEDEEYIIYGEGDESIENLEMEFQVYQSLDLPMVPFEIVLNGEKVKIIKNEAEFMLAQ